jgi:tetratricopeptide (TPR) repeat protein
LPGAKHSPMYAIKSSALTGGWLLMFSLLLGFGSLFSCSTVSAQESPEELFSRGNAYYDSTDYIGAIADYNRILQEGNESAELYHNLGNAYFESGDLGHAILNYLRAQRLDPTDSDISDNLAFARGFVSIQLEGVELNPITEFFGSLTGKASLGFWGWLTTSALLIFSCLLIYFIVTGERTLLIRVGIFALGAVFVALVSLTSFKYQQEFAADRAVVTLPEIPVSDRPSRDAKVEFKAAAGLEVVIRERSGDFALALFANKRQGWISVSALERL